MERWVGKLAVVTGASSGIGECIARTLVRNGMIVIGIARRLDRLEKLEAELTGFKGKFHGYCCDVTNDLEVGKAFIHIENNFGAISVLINNAGYGSYGHLSDQSISEVRKIFDVNVIGVVNITQHVIKNIRHHGNNPAHIIFINSVCGLAIYEICVDGGMVYTASKHALNVLFEGFRREFIKKKDNIRITNIHPGLVATEMTEGNLEEYGFPPDCKLLKVDDIAEACLSALAAPSSVQIASIVINPANQIL